MDNRNPNNKRPRDDGSDELESCPPPESKLIRADSVSSDANSGDVRDQADSDELGIDSAKAKLIQEDLLNILEESDVRDAAIQDLDSVIKSFEEEIGQVPAGTTSGSGDESSSSQPELGYLLKASDDELGLPPTNNASVESSKMEASDFAAASSSETVAALDGMLGMFDNDVIIPSYYDAFDFGVVGSGGYSSETSNGGGGEYVALGGLFDYDGGVSEVPWRTESLFAL